MPKTSSRRMPPEQFDPRFSSTRRLRGRPRQTRMWACAALAVGGCATHPHQRPPDETTMEFMVPLAATDRAIELRVGNGSVTVSHADVPACEVVAFVRAGSPSESERLAGAVELVPDEVDDGVRVIAVRTPRPSDLDMLNLCITVQIPPTVSLRVLTQQAAVVVQGYGGRLEVDTDSGDVAARMDGGETEIRSRSGGVRLSGSFTRAVVHAETGTVQVVLPDAAEPPTVNVATQAGDVTVEVPQQGRVDFQARVRGTRSVPCEPAAVWHEYGTDDGDRWRRFRGVIGAVADAAHARSSVSVVSESGRVAVRCLPGS